MRGSARLGHIYRSMYKYLRIKGLFHMTSLIVIEGPSYAGENLFQLGEATGVIKAACDVLCDCPILEVPPALLKKFATGNTNATKKDIMKVYPSASDHISDAMVLAHLGMVYLGQEKTTLRYQAEVVKSLKSKPKKKKPTQLPKGKHGVAI